MGILKNIGRVVLFFLAWQGYTFVDGLVRGALLGLDAPVFVAVIAMLLILAFFTSKFWKWYKKDFSLEIKHNPFNRYVWLPVLLWLVYIGAEFLFPVEASNNQQTLVYMTSQSPYIMGVSIVLAAPIMEELLFRGFLASYLFANQDAVWKTVFYILVSSSLFSLGHGPSTIPQFLLYFSMGAIFAIAYLTRKDLRYAIAMHMLNNAFAFVVILLA